MDERELLVTEDSERFNALAKEMHEIALKNGWSAVVLGRMLIGKDAVYVGGVYATPDSLEQIKEEGAEGLALLTCLAEIADAMDSHVPKESK